MEKAVFNFLSIKLTLMSLILVGISIFAPSHIAAQTTTDYVSQANVVFISPSAAKTKVDGKLLEINNLLGTLNNQSQEYLYTGFQRDFYTAIKDQLNSDKTVQEALEFGINILITGNASHQLPKLNRAQYKQEAINLLKA